MFTFWIMQICRHKQAPVSVYKTFLTQWSSEPTKYDFDISDQKKKFDPLYWC
jgi:hypothetical protein